MKMSTTATNAVGTVKIRSTCASILKKNYDRISVLFAAILKEKFKPNEQSTQSSIVYYDVLFSNPDGIARSISDDFIPRLQKYVDDICLEGCNLTKSVSVTGEDSSYDSDGDNYYDGGQQHQHKLLQQGCSSSSCSSHQDVSRTTSDTLAAEYAEYVQGAQQQQQHETSPGYNARVEFALKLGYTEKHVQAALQKLGVSPTQNELLAELIKLGAQKGCGSSCDSSPTDSLANDGYGHLERDDILDGSHTVTLRPIVVDGSNVAMSHGNKEVFSCRGIKICVDWFKNRGHKVITVFVPKWRKEAPRPDNPIRDQEILAELERERLLVFTPSRLVGGKRMVCYDDRYILKLAARNKGIVVSNDNYRDLCQESVEFRKVIEERILMYSFVNDHFMPPDDPLGRGGPTLDNFLKMPMRKGEDAPPPPPCPYGKKCTYGNKCKYHHPERGPLPHKSVTERLSEHCLRHLQARENKETATDDIRKNPLGRTRSNVPPPKEPQHAIVSKSRSVDNVGVLTQQQQQQQQSSILNQDFSTYQQPTAPPENLHRKLQRQLTLNPSNDSRLVSHSRRGFAPQPLSPNPGNYLNTSRWGTTADIHQCVTRIASAPDSYRGGGGGTQQQQQPSGAGWSGGILNASSATGIPSVHHMHRMSSCSDSQLNIWSGQQHQQQHQQWNPVVVGTPQQEDARRKLHYHLAAIFPEEQVLQAMRMYPEETNAQKICAAILAMSAPKV